MLILMENFFRLPLIIYLNYEKFHEVHPDDTMRFQLSQDQAKIYGTLGTMP